jgi:hypothetical protein
MKYFFRISLIAILFSLVLPAFPVTASSCKVNGPFPDTTCSPGAILPVTATQVCVSGYSKSVRNVSTKTKNAVFAEYGITSHPTGAYEVDHLISLELGGSNDIKNLFPEAAEPKPGFQEKDKVENYLHSQVCKGTISLATAQKQIATNWLAVYKTIAKATTATSAQDKTITPKQGATSKLTQSTATPAVKKSINGLCHVKGGRYYDQTKTFTAFSSLKTCVASGGKVEK